KKDPWTAGNDKGQSAAGGFQIIGKTWKENKPAGAPDDPRQATPQQQAETAATYAAKNAASLRLNNIPVNDTTVYITHMLGGSGGLSLLKADPHADARSVVGEDAARNNPRFFKGRPTVATVLQRYQEAMNEPPDEGPKPRPGAGGATAETGQNFRQRLRE